MEPQAESISDMKTHMSIKEIYETLEVYIPENVKYCPYTGSYEQMIHKAMNDNNLSMVKSLIEYRDAMIKREKKLEELYKNYPEQLSQVSGATVN
tara:strand:+ start:1300 stop:1584 length:285 start_codon:yes stop_codon:yes gene_type:complete